MGKEKKPLIEELTLERGGEWGMNPGEEWPTCPICGESLKILSGKEHGYRLVCIGCGIGQLMGHGSRRGALHTWARMVKERTHPEIAMLKQQATLSKESATQEYVDIDPDMDVRIAQPRKEGKSE